MGFHTDAATVARQSDEKLASIESLVLPLGGETFIGQVAAVARSKTSMVVYFQANPLVSSFSIRLADNSKTIQKVDGQERGLFATGMNGDEDLGQDIIMKGEPYHYRRLDAPAFFNEPTWNERMPSASGRRLFATGMNGDEDLGEDIIMKGEPFHYRRLD